MTKADGDLILARFETSPEEFAELMLVMGQRVYGFRAKSKMGRNISRAIFALIGVVIGLVLAASVGGVGPALGWINPREALLILLTLAITCTVGLTVLGRFQKRRLLSALTNSNWSKAVVISADDSGLIWTTADEKHHIAWSRFEAVAPFNDGYAVMTNIAGMYVPGRGFADAAAKQRFESILAANLVPGILGGLKV